MLKHEFGYEGCNYVFLSNNKDDIVNCVKYYLDKGADWRLPEENEYGSLEDEVLNISCDETEAMADVLGKVDEGVFLFIHDHEVKDVLNQVNNLDGQKRGPLYKFLRSHYSNTFYFLPEKTMIGIRDLVSNAKNLK